MNERLHDTELVRQIEENFGHTAGIAVMRHGELVYERYFNGHGKMDSFHIFSVTKSVTSLLIGIAMDKGLSLIHISSLVGTEYGFPST